MSGKRDSQVMPVRLRNSLHVRPSSQPHRPSRTTQQPIRLPTSLSKIFENPDIQSVISCKYFENNYIILNKETLAQIKQNHTNISALNAPSYTPEYLQASLKKIREIILVGVVLDDEDVLLLKYAIQHSNVKSILLSDIRFTGKARESFSTLFEDITKSVVENLLLKNIDIGRFFNSFISSIANLKKLKMLGISRFNIVALLTKVNDNLDGFDYLLMIVLIKLKYLNELIFTENNIKDTHYDYLFKNFYKYNQGYIITNPELDGMYVKYSMVYYATTRIGDSNEYSMTIIGINNRGKWDDKAKCSSERSIFYYASHNYSLKSNGIRDNLPDYIDIDFIIGKDNRLVKLLGKMRTCNPRDIEAFRLPNY
jgi:hypothetical protein